MGFLEKAKPIEELGHRNFWVLWGRSGTGKTHIGGTFPKPLLYVQIGDDGSNTIAEVEKIDAISIQNVDDLVKILEELKRDKKYKTVFVDTFSMFVNMWINEKVLSKGSRMTQQLWGDVKNATEKAIRAMHELAKYKNVIASCHEVMENIDGLEDEILPEAGPNLSKGARPYLQGMANYGIHTTKINRTITKDGEEKDVIRYAAHIGANPYYWTKFQVSPDVKLPSIMVNPTYNKIMKILGGN